MKPILFLICVAISLGLLAGCKKSQQKNLSQSDDSAARESIKNMKTEVVAPLAKQLAELRDSTASVMDSIGKALTDDEVRNFKDTHIDWGDSLGTPPPEIVFYLKKKNLEWNLALDTGEGEGPVSFNVSALLHGDIDGDGQEDALLAYGVEGIGGMGNYTELYMVLFLKRTRGWSRWWRWKTALSVPRSVSRSRPTPSYTAAFRANGSNTRRTTRYAARASSARPHCFTKTAN